MATNIQKKMSNMHWTYRKDGMNYRKAFKKVQKEKGLLWKFKRKHAYKDYDGDGKVNKYDCRPNDPTRQDEDGDVWEDEIFNEDSHQEDEVGPSEDTTERNKELWWENKQKIGDAAYTGSDASAEEEVSKYTPPMVVKQEEDRQDMEEKGKTWREKLMNVVNRRSDEKEAKRLGRELVQAKEKKSKPSLRGLREVDKRYITNDSYAALSIPQIIELEAAKEKNKKTIAKKVLPKQTSYRVETPERQRNRQATKRVGKSDYMRLVEEQTKLMGPSVQREIPDARKAGKSVLLKSRRLTGKLAPTWIQEASMGIKGVHPAKVERALMKTYYPQKIKIEQTKKKVAHPRQKNKKWQEYTGYY